MHILMEELKKLITKMKKIVRERSILDRDQGLMVVLTHTINRRSVSRTVNIDTYIFYRVK